MTLVKPLYLDRPDLFEHTATVTQVGESPFNGKLYTWIKLDETIFHPKGGGQLSDEGTIAGQRVIQASKEIFEDLNHIEILHYVETGESFSVGQVVQLSVDAENRHRNSVWHTAAHVVDYLVVKQFPQLKGDLGQCYPGAAFMKFTSTDGSWPSSQEVKDRVNEAFPAFLEAKVPLDVIRGEDGFRKLQIGDHPINCGGTHVHDWSELGTLEVRKVAFEKKENKLRVSYQVTR